MSVRNLAILTDVTRCTGCESCVEACRRVNDLPAEKPWRWVQQIDDLSSARWTTIRALPAPDGTRYVRRQCRHCLDPECVSVCIVGALKKTPEGPVVYNRDICIGCRYCLIACPWEIPRYSWEDTVPYVQKCDLCYERAITGRAPACVEACPTEATIFGDRDELLAEAHRRIAADPGAYIDKVWGETEVGGTSVLYISDVDLNLTDLETGITSTDPMPHRTTKILHKMPVVFVGMAAVMGGVHWAIRRRQELMSGPPGAADPEPTDVAAAHPETGGSPDEEARE
ncbi:MAG: 4Fe-4S dicluster domain-containing protein [Thermoanaerobaculales bacterium]|jgi:formate dehydrogenase iron-sulfur subunit|nr:4Fe-4S dicluster domain-containing protein [Thermoanaerobaculales bacterium]